MNKEEILAKSRNDYAYGDELEKQNDEKAVSLANGIIVGIIVMNYVFGFVQGDVKFFGKVADIEVLFGGLVALNLLITYGMKFYYSYKKRYLVFAILCLVALIVGLIRIF